jgi:hypothetical protein
LLCAATIFVVLETSQTKLDWYLTPILPFLAIAALDQGPGIARAKIVPRTPAPNRAWDSAGRRKRGITIPSVIILDGGWGEEQNYG